MRPPNREIAALCKARNVQELFGFIQSGEFRKAGVDALLERVGEALDSLPEDDPRYPQLAKIEEELLDGKVPLRRLEKFADRFGPDPLELLDAELRGRAAQLPRSAWHTPVYRRLEQALKDWKQGQQQPLHEFCGRHQQLLEQSQQEFEADMESDEAPVLVAQKLLLEGIRGWQGVLQRLRTDPSEKVLPEAQNANRLIAVVCEMEQRYPELLQ